MEIIGLWVDLVTYTYSKPEQVIMNLITGCMFDLLMNQDSFILFGLDYLNFVHLDYLRNLRNLILASNQHAKNYYDFSGEGFSLWPF